MAVVGAGWWSSLAHLPSLAADRRVEIVGISDAHEDRARLATELFGGRAYADPEEMFSAERPDGVLVATPHATHARIASAALAAGAHVLVEKPLATTAGDAWQLVTQARHRERLLAAGLTYQFAETAPAIRAAVRHEIGALRSVNADFSSNAGEFFAATDPDTNVDDPAAPHPITYADPATGGGQAHTQLSHLLGALLWAAGEQAVDVVAMTANHGLAVDLVDALAFRLTGGALCVASSTGTSPDGVSARHRIRFHGTEGMVEWDMLTASAVVHRRGGHVSLIEHPVHLPTYPRERVVTSFVSSIIDGTPTPAPADAAAASVSLIEAALEAAATGARTAVVQGDLHVADDRSE